MHAPGGRCEARHFLLHGARTRLAVSTYRLFFVRLGALRDLGVWRVEWHAVGAAVRVRVLRDLRHRFHGRQPCPVPG